MKDENSHEWIKIQDDIATIGISLYVKEEFGDIFNIKLPSVGDKIEKGKEACVLETGKSAIEIPSPYDGEIVEINEKLKEDLNDLNEDPEDRGWLFKIKVQIENLEKD